MSSAEQTPHTGMSRSAEIRLVAGRELRTQLFKRASLVTAVVMLVLAVGGILVYARFSGGDDDPYRLGVIAPDAAASSAIASDLAQVKDSEGRTVSIVDLTGSAAGPALGIGDGAGEARADMVLDLTDQRPRLLVTKESDSDRAVTTSVTAVLQQSALAQKVTDLGGDPAAVAGGLLAAVPQVEALDPPRYDAADFGPRYGMLLTIDVLLIAVIMAGGPDRGHGRRRGEVEQNRGDPPGLCAPDLSAGREGPGHGDSRHRPVRPHRHRRGGDRQGGESPARHAPGSGLRPHRHSHVDGGRLCDRGGRLRRRRLAGQPPGGRPQRDDTTDDDLHGPLHADLRHDLGPLEDDLPRAGLHPALLILAHAGPPRHRGVELGGAARGPGDRDPPAARAPGRHDLHPGGHPHRRPGTPEGGAGPPKRLTGPVRAVRRPPGAAPHARLSVRAGPAADGGPTRRRVSLRSRGRGTRWRSPARRRPRSPSRGRG